MILQMPGVGATGVVQVSVPGIGEYTSDVPPIGPTELNVPPQVVAGGGSTETVTRAVSNGFTAGLLRDRTDVPLEPIVRSDHRPGDSRTPLA